MRKIPLHQGGISSTQLVKARVWYFSFGRYFFKEFLQLSYLLLVSLQY
ncbi:MAG: CRISPR-associated protein Cas5 [Chitinophagaceae bacterium]|nr:MAG: CRISPR-associated protein Cas5 [Chitinophagaceae bacterium]